MRQDVAGALGWIAWRGLVASVALVAMGCRATPRQDPRPQAEPRPATEVAAPGTEVAAPGTEVAAPATAASGARKLYLTAGHGELTHPGSQPAGQTHQRRGSELRRAIGALGYDIAELGPGELARAIPGDAAVVVVPGPAVALRPGEWAALERYLDRGGRVLIALDPGGATSMGALEGRLGLRMLPGRLLDDKQFLPQRGTSADWSFAITNQFSMHASTNGLARMLRGGLVLIDAGALEEIPFTSRREPPRRAITIRSMDSAWLDLEQPRNFQLDAPGERRQRWTIGAAVEGPRLGGRDGFRALVFADADLFADVAVPDSSGRPRTLLASGPLLADSLRWLAGEDRNQPGGGPPAPKNQQVAPPLDIKRPPADAIRTPSGLVYKKLVASAAGAVAKRNDTVLIHYTGWRQSTGETFGSSRPRGQPRSIDLASAAPGFVEAMQLVGRGEKAMLWIPPSIGIQLDGPAGSETLVYEVEVVDIQAAPAIPADLKAPPAKAKALRSGIRYVVIRPGPGKERPRGFDTVTFHVTAWDRDGRQIESTEVRGRPQKRTPFHLPAVLEEVLTSIPVGQRVRFWVDADKVQTGGRELPGKPTGLLTYELELLEIEQAAAAPPPAPADVAKPPAGAKQTARGVPYRVLKAGPGGPKPRPTEIVRVHYTGWTTDGRMFDSSIHRGEPIDFPLDAMIAGWTDGLQVMSVGDQVRFWIPEELAYKGSPGRPQGTLVFDVELLEIKPAR